MDKKGIIYSIVIILIVALLTTTASMTADGEGPTITFENTSKNCKNVRLFWIDHPFGCRYTVVGTLNCGFSAFTAEIQSGQTITHEPNCLIYGSRYVVVWDDRSGIPSEEGESTVGFPFEATEDVESVYTTPTKLTIKYFIRPERFSDKN